MQLRDVFCDFSLLARMTLLPSKHCVLLLVAAMCLPNFLDSYEIFRDRIPNGRMVPSPCKTKEIWPGVGHLLTAGTGNRNPFGLDFEKAGYMWTEALCRMDSDGDGMYNGLELGDPNCVWKENSMPESIKNLSHPGVCDPWNSTRCAASKIVSPKFATQGDWFKDVCKTEGFQCAALDDPKIRTAAVRLPGGTPVPPKITIYECMMFNLHDLGMPRDTDFHMVAVTPLINNTNVVHHIVLFGCTDDTPMTNSPFECDMIPTSSCTEFYHVWTVGLEGECYHPYSGVKLGKTGAKIVAIQLHWNNADGAGGKTDASGLMLHYTPNLKQYDAGVFLVGSALFTLPPRKEHVSISSQCSSKCTRRILRGPIYISAAWNHMHFTGKDMVIEVQRQNKHRGFLTEESDYNYDTPQVNVFSDAFQILPGDSILTTCGYTTKDRNLTVFYGDATLDEMCFGFITYFPRQNLSETICVDRMGISLCEPSTLGGCTNMVKFLKKLTTLQVYKDVTAFCKILTPCLQECVDLIVRHIKSEPCMKGHVWNYIKHALSLTAGPGQEFLSRISSCAAEVEMTFYRESLSQMEITDPPTIDGASGSTLCTTLVVVSLSTLGFFLFI